MIPAMWIDVPNGRLAAERWENGGPRVVLLHAGVSDRRGWREVGPLLEGDVIAYDRRGHGETEFEEGAGFSHLDDLEAVLGGEPAWLVGSSMGGALALTAALARPELVTGLVLIAPAVYGQPEEEDDPATRALNEQLWETEDIDEGTRICAHLWLDGPAESEGRVGGAPRELARAMCARMFELGLEDEDGDPGIETWSRLEEIAAPAVVAVGDLDTRATLQRSRTVGERLPGADGCVALARRAHLPHLEDPTGTAALIHGGLKSAR